MPSDDSASTTERTAPSTPSLIPFVVVGLIALAVGALLVPALLSDIQASKIRGYGAERTGRVVSLEDTGNRFNDDPVVIVTVELEEKGSRVRGSVKDAISPVHLPRYQPGSLVRVWINPDSPTEIALEEGL